MVNNKIIPYSLTAILVSIGIVYCLVASDEYQGAKESSSFGIDGETNEQLFETTFFSAIALVNFGLAAWVVTSKRSVLPYISSGVVSAALIVTYIASRTVGVPIVGVEYYVGKLDIISKVLQISAIALSTVAVYKFRNLRIVKGLVR